jgi:hypothetical protein
MVAAGFVSAAFAQDGGGQLELERGDKREPAIALEALERFGSTDIVSIVDTKTVTLARVSLTDRFARGDLTALDPTLLVTTGMHQSVVVDWFSDENMSRLIEERAIPGTTEDATRVANAIRVARESGNESGAFRSMELRDAARVLRSEAFRCLSGQWKRDGGEATTIGAHTYGGLLLKQSVVAEAHAHYDNVRLMSMQKLAQVQALSRRTVGIAIDDGVNPPVVRGSGVLFTQGHGGSILYYVATAAHVVMVPQAFRHKAIQQGDFMPQRIVIRLADPRGRFDDPRLSMVLSDDITRTRISGESDYLVSRIDVPEELKQLVHEALGVVPAKATTLDECNMGLVFGFSAVRDGEPELTWIPPGRIVFPAIVTRPTTCLDRSDQDDWYERAIAQQIASNGRYDLSPSELFLVCEQVWQAYSMPGVPGRHALGGDVGDPGLNTFMSKSGTYVNVRIRCFGTDLPSKDGCSGGPLYDLSQTPPRLIGIVSGIAGSETNRRQLRSLKNFSRAIPWSIVTEGPLP